MTLTPMEIHNKHFNTKMRGYDKEQVDSFLDRIVDAYGDALDKIVDLKNENAKLQNEVAHYIQVKDSLNASLLEAQDTASQVKAKAQKQAKEIVGQANKKAADQIKTLEAQQVSLKNDYELLKGKIADFRVQTKSLLKAQLEQLDDDSWQVYLDQYYGRQRLYPADGGEPVLPDSENDDEAASKASTPIDNHTAPAVNSKHGSVSNASKVTPEPVSVSPQAPKPSGVTGPVIVFPEDYKNHK